MSWQAPQVAEDLAAVAVQKSEYSDLCGRPLGEGLENDPRSTPSLARVSAASCDPSTLSIEWQK